MRGRLVTFSPIVLFDLLGMDDVVDYNDVRPSNDIIAMELIGMNWP